jgi:acyl-coenzyme A thioesterase PaaI-like protein
VASAFLPLARNHASQPLRIDEGAVAGLADSCAAYAAHLCETHVGERGGVTVSMALAFHSARAEDVIGTGVVTSRVAGSYIAVVEVSGATSGASAASGFAVYRLPG